jgi:hypothetical protein
LVKKLKCGGHVDFQVALVKLKNLTAKFSYSPTEKMSNRRPTTRASASSVSSHSMSRIDSDSERDEKKERLPMRRQSVSSSAAPPLPPPSGRAVHVPDDAVETLVARRSAASASATGPDLLTSLGESANTYAFAFIKDMDKSFARFDRMFSVLWVWLTTPFRMAWTWLIHQPFIGRAVEWISTHIKDAVTYAWRQAVSWWWFAFKQFWHFLCWFFARSYEFTIDLYTLWFKHWWLITKVCATVGCCAWAATYTLSAFEQGKWHPWLILLARWSQYGCSGIIALLTLPISLPPMIVGVGFMEREAFWQAVQVPLLAVENLGIHLMEALRDLFVERLLADVYHTAHIFASSGFWPVVRVFFALAGWVLFLLMLAWVVMFDVAAFVIGSAYTLLVWLISSVYSLFGVLPQQEALPEWREVRKMAEKWWGVRKPSALND